MVISSKREKLLDNVLVYESYIHTPYEETSEVLPGTTSPKGPFGPLVESDYEIIMFPHRLTATHFLHPGNEFAISSAWPLLFYFNKTLTFISHPSSFPTLGVHKVPDLEGGSVAMPIFQEDIQRPAQSHMVAESQLTLGVAREHGIHGGEGQGGE